MQIEVSCLFPQKFWQRKVAAQLQFSPLAISNGRRITGVQILFLLPPVSMLPPKQTLTLHLLRSKPSLPLMLWVWSMLTENPPTSWHLNLVTVYARFKENLHKLLCLLAFFQVFSSSSSSSSIWQVHLPLKGIWQMDCRPFSPEQCRRNMCHSPPGTAEQG